VDEKLKCWDINIRTLAGEALSILSMFNPSLVIDKYLPIIYDNCFSKNLYIRHGAIWGLGELILGLAGLSYSKVKEHIDESFKNVSKKEKEILKDSENKKKASERFAALIKNNLDMVSEATITKCKELISELLSRKLTRGKGGELMRLAMCHYIKCTSSANLPYTNDELFYHYRS
jgi:hypothetical protein